tara:strand:+ start:386 stop:1018 length:633 start_codon:yes stop_codon:yes gene_type:complete
MPGQNKRVRLTVFILVAFVAMIVGLFVALHMEKDLSKFHGTLLNKPRAVSPFTLTGTDGKSFSNSDLQGRWTMMFFGFTNCGYLCPTTMSELGKMYRFLEEKGVKNLPNVMMVSIDPERDSLERLNQYVKAFNPNFYGARGDEKNIKGMTKEFGIAYFKVALKNSSDEKNYDVEHTGTVMLFNPQGELRAFFTTPHQGDQLAEDYLLLTS